MTDSRWTRLRNIIRPSIKREVDDELAFHIDMATRELIDQGVDPARARELAHERFGPVSTIEAALVDSTHRRRHRADRAEAFADLTQDVRYALRSLRHSPAFAGAAITTLALGVGATLAVFTVVSGVLVRPLPYRDPSGINMIWITQPNRDGSTFELPLTSGFFSDIARDSRGFRAMAAFRGWSYSLSSNGGEPEQVAGARVSPELFDVLGVRPYAGRTFTRQEAVPGGPSVMVISHDLWKRKFGGDPSVVGRQVSASGRTFTILGIMPPGFAFPRGAELPAAFQFALRTDVWTPLAFDSAAIRDYGTMNLSAIGRLKSDESVPAARQRAEAELNAMMQNFLQQNAPTLKLGYRVKSLIDQAGQPVRRGLYILLGAVVCVLLIAGANVASLLVARVGSRRRELAVRAAIGAGRGRIARQLVTENLVLALAGTTLGALLAFWATKAMLALVPGSMPRADDIATDWRVLGAAAAVAIAAGVVFGVLATYAVPWTKIASSLHAGDSRSAGSVSQRYGRRALVAVEVGLSVMLLIAASLLTRSFVELQRVRSGFDPSHVLTAGVSLPIPGAFAPLKDGPEWARKLNDMTARLDATPGVVAAGAVSSLPLTGAFESGGFRIPGHQYDVGQNPSAQYNVISGRYFAAAGIRVVVGRTFDASDDEPGRASMMVNREFARKYFGSPETAVGREVQTLFDFAQYRQRTVIGVVEDVKQTALDEEPRPQMYVPQSQMAYPGLALVVRSKGDAATALPALKQIVRAVDPRATINDVRTMEDVVSYSLSRQRFSMTLVGTFATLALVLAIVGLYGVLVLIVGQRRREIGVRLALGAQRRDVVRLVLSESARVTLVGVVLGLAGAYALTRVMAALLYGVGATDAGTFVGAAAVVALVAMAATYAPARRASRVDPRAALTTE